MESDKIILYDIPGYAAEDRAWVCFNTSDIQVISLTRIDSESKPMEGSVRNSPAYCGLATSLIPLLALC